MQTKYLVQMRILKGFFVTNSMYFICPYRMNSTLMAFPFSTGCLSSLESGTPFYKSREDRWLFQLTTMCRQVLYYKVCILLTMYYRVSLWSDFPPLPPMSPEHGDFTSWTLVSCAIKH